jgi:hypothetical protein
MEQYDYSEDFSEEELHDEERPKYPRTIEDQLRDLGMSTNDFI